MMIKAILLVAFPLVLIFGIDWKTVRTGIFRTDVMRYEDTENLRNGSTFCYFRPLYTEDKSIWGIAWVFVSLLPGLGVWVFVSFFSCPAMG